MRNKVQIIEICLLLLILFAFITFIYLWILITNTL
jgi:hypothetical protein